MKNRIVILLALLLASCKPILHPEPPVLVVDGFIDAGGFPQVHVSTSIPIDNEEHDFSTVFSHVVRWAKVTIDDGEQSVVLTGRKDYSLTPPFVYTTTWMRGRPGGIYKISVDYEDFHAEAVASIPEKAPELDSIDFRKDEKDDVHVTVSFTDTPGRGNFYKLFIREEGEDRTWYSAVMTTVSDEGIDGGRVELAVMKPFRLKEGLVPVFKSGEVFFLKFASISEDMYRFWRSFDDLQVFSTNPFVSVTSTLQSNLDGAVGCWAGYSSTIYRIEIP